MELLGVGTPQPMIAYALRRLARAVLTLLGVDIVAALLATAGAPPCGSSGMGAQPCDTTVLAWLGATARLDFGRTVDGQAVGSAIAAALPASAILVVVAMLITLLVGWGGGALLVLAEQRERNAMRPSIVLRGMAALAELGQGVPVFWLGGLLVGIFAVGLGWLPPGGIAAPDVPAFGTAAYLDALAAHPDAILGDLLGHLALPAVVLALAGLATDLRLVAAALAAELHAPHMRVAAGLGLSRRHLLWRAVRPAGAAVIVGSAAGAPLLAGALVLVEYLFGWPGLGLLAYHAARAGDSATMAALLLLFGLVVIALGAVADVLAAWADTRLRGAVR